MSLLWNPGVSMLRAASAPGILLRFDKAELGSGQPLGSIQAGLEQLEQPWEKNFGMLGDRAGLDPAQTPPVLG